MTQTNILWGKKQTMDNEFYIRFEDRFRGSREMIKERLKVYLPILGPLNNYYSNNFGVDLGCGRGEWLELLRETGWQATGVDTNLSMVNYCQQSGLNAICEDAIAFLRSIGSDTISVVTGFHIAEHLPFELLVELVKESYRALLPGGFLILETPNSENIMVGTSSFYLDPTHLNPIPHELMSFLTENCGFQRTKVLRLQELPDLRASNTTDLFTVLSGVSPDYAIIAQKGATPEILEAFDTEFTKAYGITLETLAHRYDSQVASTNQKISLELSEIRREIDEFRAVQAELQQVYNSRSYRITAPIRAVFGFMQVLHERMHAKANKILIKLANEIVKHPKLKTNAFLLLKHFPGLQTRIKRLTASTKYEISSSDFLSEDPNTLSIRERQIYFDLLKVVDNKRGR